MQRGSGNVAKDGTLSVRDGGAQCRLKTIGRSALVVEKLLPFDLMYLPLMTIHVECLQGFDVSVKLGPCFSSGKQDGHDKSLRLSWGLIDVCRSTFEPADVTVSNHDWCHVQHWHIYKLFVHGRSYV